MDFTKKPVTIQAIEWTGDNADEIIAAAVKDTVKKKGKGLICVTASGEIKVPKDHMVIMMETESYPCAPDIFAETYNEGAGDGVDLDSLDDGDEKTLTNSSISGARDNVPDIKVVGNGDAFKLLCKASSQREGWMKSTKAMQVAGGALVQVTTQQRNPDGSYAVAEALCYVPGGEIMPDVNGGHKMKGNK